MSWSLSSDAENFALQMRPILYARESLHCLAWAAIKRAKIGPSTSSQYRFLITDESDRAAAYAIVNQRNGNLILSEMEECAAYDLASFLDLHQITVCAIEGPREAVQAFTDSWTARPGRHGAHQMDQGLYELVTVKLPETDGGRLVRVTQAQRDTLYHLAAGFCGSFPSQSLTTEQLTRRVDRFLVEEHAYLWQTRDQVFVSMAAVVRESPNTSSISWVYTPPAYRRRGYAARIVASLSSAQLSVGKRACNLHTDLANPTSNRVYQRIGYQLIAERLKVALIDDLCDE